MEIIKKRKWVKGTDCSTRGGSASGGKSVARALRRFSEGSAFGGESSPAHQF